MQLEIVIKRLGKEGGGVQGSAKLIKTSIIHEFETLLNSKGYDFEKNIFEGIMT